ncbi:hypothetical protein RRG08_054302 [Elysia crispata]|uniref:Uncharacterized protein n=1 Tax=Elysia crispata TaxID=231223 RepID=A0AAE1D9X9_9GAST|nr:hypothetical protein RRG08_054302 [Elysia crispata]
MTATHNGLPTCVSIWKRHDLHLTTVYRPVSTWKRHDCSTQRSTDLCQHGSDMTASHNGLETATANAAGLFMTASTAGLPTCVKMEAT